MKRLIVALRCICLICLISCAGSAPRLYTFEDMETYPASFDQVWQIVSDISDSKKWRIDESENTGSRAYIATDWMADTEHGGDYGSVGISLGQANKPLNDRTKEVAINIRVVSETATTTRVKITCLFRVQTSQGHSGTGQTMFGTSKGVVEEQLLNTIRSRLAAS